MLREVTPGVPVTTNLMGAFYPLNYRRWAQEMDVVSWDNYPRPEEPIANVAFNHALMRGLKEGQPFLLMEQSPSQQNWMPYNALTRKYAARITPRCTTWAYKRILSRRTPICPATR